MRLNLPSFFSLCLHPRRENTSNFDKTLSFQFGGVQVVVNQSAIALKHVTGVAVSLQALEIIPIIRIFDVGKAKEFAAHAAR